MVRAAALHLVGSLWPLVAMSFAPHLPPSLPHAVSAPATTARLRVISIILYLNLRCRFMRAPLPPCHPVRRCRVRCRPTRRAPPNARSCRSYITGLLDDITALKSALESKEDQIMLLQRTQRDRVDTLNGTIGTLTAALQARDERLLCASRENADKLRSLSVECGARGHGCVPRASRGRMTHGMRVRRPPEARGLHRDVRAGAEERSDWCGDPTCVPHAAAEPLATSLNFARQSGWSARCASAPFLR
jgi:hypothetical protein